MDLIRAGRALLFRESPKQTFHLFFILTDPDGSPPRVVAVMVRTATKFTDETVLLEPGDHPFINRTSSVHYSSANVFRVNRLQKGFEERYCYLKEDMSQELLERVREGLAKSPFTVPAIRDYCADRFT